MMMDYKFWYIRRDDDGFILDCAIRLYEGDLQTVTDILKGTQSSQYIRSKKLQMTDGLTLGSRVLKDNLNQDNFLFTQKDFGKIKTSDELRSYFNQQLPVIALSINHTIINEQKV